MYHTESYLYFHRLVIDFSHDVEKPNFTEFFDDIVSGIMEVLQPHFEGSQSYGQEVWITAGDCTEEYDDLYDNGVQELRQELSDDDSLDKFFQSLRFKDYPREVDPDD